MLEAVTSIDEPILSVKVGTGINATRSKFKIADMVELMGWRAIGAKLMNYSKTVEMEWEELPKEENPQPELF